jgi:hypothetical protein
MEASLTGDSAFSVYKPGTMVRSSTTGTVDFFENDVDASVQRQVLKHVSFTAVFSTSIEVEIKVWFGSESFLADYPHTYISQLVYPGDPTKLLTGNYTNVISAVSSVTGYIANAIKTPTHNTDITGAFEYRSKYNPGGTASPYSISFVLLYKGQVPSTQVARDYIKDALIALNLTPDVDNWREALPDLFTNGHYYLIPVWDNTYAAPGTTLDRGTLDYDHAIRVARAVFPAYPELFIRNNMVVVKAASSSQYILGVPALDNDSGFLSLAEEHPTYQPVDARGDYFDYQEDKTKEFNISFANCMAVLKGASNDNVFSEDEFYERSFLTFINNFREYHVLKSDSFPTTL